MSRFRVAVVDGLVKISSEDEVPETDINDLLEFNESQIEDLYRTHAAVQARWEQLAINRRNKLELFRDDFEKKWWAHNKKFGKLLSLSYGEKTPTMESIKDNVILIYSEETIPLMREKYEELAYQESLKKPGLHYGSREDFNKDMFKYLYMNPPWFFEGLTRTVSMLKQEVETLQNIAKRLEARSFHMKDLKDLVMAKRGNLGPMSDREVNNIQRMQSYKPNLQSEQNEDTE